MLDDFFIKHTEDAMDLPLPKYMTEFSSGMDLYANIHHDESMIPGEFKTISAGVMLSMPNGYEAQIRPRSGLAYKYGITLLNALGTIDADYRGEIKIILINHGKDIFTISRGARIAQLVVMRVEKVIFKEVTGKLSQTKRGNGGFGHTGV